MILRNIRARVEISDFHTVDYEALSMLNISATQELYKKIQLIENENVLLKKENAAKADVSTVDALKTEIIELKKLIVQTAAQVQK